jgi:hypothetical protein
MVLLAMGSEIIAVQQEQRSFEGLIAAAEAVVAVEVLSTDYTATQVDGPMVATAKVLKVLKGRLTTGKQFSFAETAWVGPTYQKGEHRILFLEKAKPAGASKATEWRIFSHLRARTDFFVEKDSIPALSLESLESFLKKVQDSKERPKKVVFGKSTF